MPDASPLGLPDLPRFVELDAEASRVRPGAAAGSLLARLLAFAREARLEPLARAALLEASRLARTAAEKRAVGAAWEAWSPRSPGTERAAIAAAIGLARVAATRAEAAGRLAGLASGRPDAPEDAPDLFEPADHSLFRSAVASGNAELRLRRARALLGRDSGGAAGLALPLAKLPPFRLEAADVLLAAGRAKAARNALVRPSAFQGRDEAERLRVEALLLSADLRLLPDPARKRSATKPRRSRPASPPVRGVGPSPPPDGATLRSGLALLARADALLARPLAAADRRRVLADAVRAALRIGKTDEARRLLSGLVSIDPATTVGAEELFRAAFQPTLSRAPRALRDAAVSLRDQAALYGDVAVRRRATYWAARSLETLGDPAARPLYASLVSTAVPDLYARWAGARLGVPVVAAVPVEPAAPVTKYPLGPDSPSLPSRELLAVGLASLAEDAAEAERSVEPLFLAACAAERFELRRATAILKGRWPELGTPDEGAVPLVVRRAYYPFRQEPLIVREAAANRLPPALVYGVIRQESLFQTTARSGAGATGLMQVMPGTGRYLLRKEGRRGRPNLRDPEVNVALGARYLAMMLQEFGGERVAALAGYNAGPGRPKRWRRLAPALEADEFLEAIPLFETRDYVKRVLFFEAAYSVLHGVAVDPLPAGGAPVSPRP